MNQSAKHLVDSEDLVSLAFQCFVNDLFHVLPQLVWSSFETLVDVGQKHDDGLLVALSLAVHRSEVDDLLLEHLLVLHNFINFCCAFGELLRAAICLCLQSLCLALLGTAVRPELLKVLDLLLAAFFNLSFPFRKVVHLVSQGFNLSEIFCDFSFKTLSQFRELFVSFLLQPELLFLLLVLFLTGCLGQRVLLCFQFLKAAHLLEL